MKTTSKQEFNARTLMADTKFYEAYSRYDDSKKRYETWEEAIERVMNMHRSYYQNKLTPELEELIIEAELAYKDKLFLGAQRALQFGGEQLLKHQMRLYNCFHPATKFVTSEGVKSFSDFAENDICYVPTHTGKWQKAVVKSYGIQNINKVTFKKGSSRFTTNVTPDHRWILKDGTETTSLSIGDKVQTAPDSFKTFKWEEATDLEQLYWLYGLVYGDGTVGTNGYSKIRLCDKDRKYESRFLEHGFKSSSSASLKGDIIISTGSYQKTAPDPSKDSVELIRAFVAGYLAADGEKNRNMEGKQYISIQSSEVDHIEFIRKCFPIAGVYILNEIDLTGKKTNFGIRPYTIKFSLYEGVRDKQDKSWIVESIDPKSTEIVWCLEVEEDQSFTLENGIITGNCASTYCDRPAVFGETMYALLCGAGVGFSVQKQHITKLPKIAKRTKSAKTFVIPDSIEGWSKAIDVLMSSFFVGGGKYPEYEGRKIYFDLSEIRPKGAFISGGFKAPGPEPLRQALDKIELLIKSELDNNNEITVRPIVAYDIMMYLADAVISGGVRRSATICMFSKDDEEMIKAKTGDWFVANPQRGRSNNSVMLLRNDTTKEEFAKIMESVQHSGEPGFIWTDNLEFTLNPCVEVGMRPIAPNKESGFQVCNLTEINGGKSTSKDIFLHQCKVASILGTLQAGYTDFKYFSQATKDIVDQEALIGVGITGVMNNPQILTDPEILKEGAKVVRYWNKIVAEMIGINQAARTTVIKPAGNSSVLLETASGIHGEHSPRYLRHVQFNSDTEIAQALLKDNPEMCEDSVWSAGQDIVAAFPIISPETSLYKKELLGIKQLEHVKNTQQSWIEYGTNIDRCVDKNLRHNVSNTITVDNWDEVTDYIYDNRKYLCGVSLLAAAGDRAYPQAPFTEVFTHEQIIQKYGEMALFTSALIEAGLNAFNNNLWTACDTALGWGEQLTDNHKNLLKRDFVRRFNKFAENFESKVECSNCLKDVYNLHKWWKIQSTIENIPWVNKLQQKVYTNVDTTGAQACAGGQCDL